MTDVASLRRALEACDVSADRIFQTTERLTHPPISLHISAFDDPETESLIRSVVSFDRDLAARMFCSKAWKDLTRAEQKRVRRQWEWTVNKPDNLNLSPKGRPAIIDPAFVLWCGRVLTEAGGRLPFGRHWQGGRPRGLEAFLVVMQETHAASDRQAGMVTQARMFDEPRHL